MQSKLVFLLAVVGVKVLWLGKTRFTHEYLIYGARFR
jgi:hypothetical protein